MIRTKTGEREKEMAEIREELQNLEASPLIAFRRQNQYSVVTGEGSLEAELMFVGEAPGEKEAKTGRPFVGASGRFLSELLDSIGLKREDVYITNIVKDRPPGNRDPSQEEIDLYAPFLLRQIEIIQPKMIATLGRFAMDFLLETFQMPQAGEKIGALHGQALKAQADFGELWVVPLYHPAVALYAQEKREVLLQDFQTLKRILTGDAG